MRIEREYRHSWPETATYLCVSFLLPRRDDSIQQPPLPLTPTPPPSCSHPFLSYLTPTASTMFEISAFEFKWHSFPFQLFMACSKYINTVTKICMRSENVKIFVYFVVDSGVHNMSEYCKIVYADLIGWVKYNCSCRGCYTVVRGYCCVISSAKLIFIGSVFILWIDM